MYNESKAHPAPDASRIFLKRENQKFQSCHPNSLLARAKADPSKMERILNGMREADDDLQSMERWARRGFVGG